MKKIFTVLALSCAVAAYAVPASAQVSVEAAAPQEQPKFNDAVRTDTPQTDFTNRAQERAARAAIRKERNTIEFNAALNGSLSNFNSKWQKVNGNVNSITGIASFLFTHNFTKERFTLDNKATGKLGATSQERSWTKSQDEWFVSTSPSYKMSDNWNAGGTVSFRSQFANGVNDANERTSRFLAPGYLNVSLGFTYVCPDKKFPVKINLAPIAMSATYVESATVRSVFYNNKFGTKGREYDEYLKNHDLRTLAEQHTPYCYGLTLADGTSRYEGGSSIQIDFDRTFGKNEVFRYRTTLYSFYGWISEAYQQAGKDAHLYEHILPTLRWEHTIDIKATKYFSTQFYFQMLYNRAQINSLQTQIVLGVGLSYTFKNK